jgi:predicted dehydrogenase
VPLALRPRQHLRRGALGLLSRGDTHPRALGRARREVPRVRRDDLVTFHVDGTLGSAVAGLTDVFTQPRVNTPKAVWNPDVKQQIDFFAGWQTVPDYAAFDNGFKVQWEAFIRHVVEGEPYKWDLIEGAKGVQLVECALQSWRERRWIDVPALEV